jgi:hypothetical protein
LLDGQGLNMIIVEKVVESAAVRLVQQKPLVDTVRAVWVLWNGRGVNLIKIAGASLCGLRAAANTRPNVPFALLASGFFRQENGAGRIDDD